MRYEYRCQNSHIFTVEFAMGKNPGSVQCEECGEEAIRYITTSTPIHWKPNNNQPDKSSSNEIGSLAYM